LPTSWNCRSTNCHWPRAAATTTASPTARPSSPTLSFTYNSGVSQQQVKDLFATYQGVDLTFLGSLGVNSQGGTSWPWYDGTGHLDMWFLPIDDETVVIGQYSPSEWNGIPHQVTEDAAALMQSRGYTVLRTPRMALISPQLPWHCNSGPLHLHQCRNRQRHRV
jgi:hypothetical protein